MRRPVRARRARSTSSTGATCRPCGSGDFGTSIASRRPITEELRERFPATIELALAAMLFATMIGIPLGFVAAKHYGTSCRPREPVRLADRRSRSRSSSSRSSSSRSSPCELGWLPSVGRQDVLIDAEHPTNFYVLDAIITRNWNAFWDAIKHLILPGDRARLDPARDHRADHARLGARRPERGLRPHGARQGHLAARRSTAGTCCETRCCRSRRSSACRWGCSSRARSSPRPSSPSPGSAPGSRRRSRTATTRCSRAAILFVAVIFVLVNLRRRHLVRAPQPADPPGRPLMSVAEIESPRARARAVRRRPLARRLVQRILRNPGAIVGLRAGRALRVRRALRAADRALRPDRAEPRPRGERLLSRPFARAPARRRRARPRRALADRLRRSLLAPDRRRLGRGRPLDRASCSARSPATSAASIDSVIMRVMDIMLAIPGFLMAIGIVALLGPGPAPDHDRGRDRQHPDLRAAAARLDPRPARERLRPRGALGRRAAAGRSSRRTSSRTRSRR